MEESLGTPTAAGNKGDKSIVSNAGDALYQEPLCDIFTQNEHCYDDVNIYTKSEDIKSEDIKEEDSCYEDVFDSTGSEVLEWDSNYDQFSDDHTFYSENSSRSRTFSDVIDNLSNY